MGEPVPAAATTRRPTLRSEAATEDLRLPGTGRTGVLLPVRGGNRPAALSRSRRPSRRHTP